MPTIARTFPHLTQDVMHHHFSRKANEACTYKAYVGGFQRIFNRQSVEVRYWPPEESESHQKASTAYISMKVPPSMKNGDTVIYNAWAKLNVLQHKHLTEESFDSVISVATAGCSDGVCKAAKGGKCIHVGALLWCFILLDRPADIAHLVQSEKTASLCAWNRPTVGPMYDFLLALRYLSFTQNNPNREYKKKRKPAPCSRTKPWRSCEYNPITGTNERDSPGRSRARQELYDLIKKRTGTDNSVKIGEQIALIGSLQGALKGP